MKTRDVLTEALSFFGPTCGLGFDKDGHEGRGWYVWSTEYPDEGSLFVGKRRPTKDRWEAAIHEASKNWPEGWGGDDLAHVRAALVGAK